MKLSMAEEIVFLLHGYNVDRPSGMAGLKNLASFVERETSGATVAVLWPGDSCAGFISYPFEGDDADDTALELAQYITDTLPAHIPLSFVTHSLGARVAMETIDALRATWFDVNQVCLMAPAIDDFSLASSSSYRDAVDAVKRVAVLSSTEDIVLKIAYPAGELVQNFLFFWREELGFALGYSGPKDSEDGDQSEPVPGHVIHWPIDPARGSDHGHYVPDFTFGNETNSVEHRNQLSAARYASQVVGEKEKPDYG